MKEWFLALFVSILIPTAFASPPQILVLGDSLSAGYGVPLGRGWVDLLQQRLRERGYPHAVFNASVSGDTTAGGVTRLPSLLEQRKPQVVIIELGANDGLRGFGFDQIRANLQRLIQLARASGSQVLLVGVRLPPNYGAAYVERFQAIFRELSNQEQIALVPYLLAGVAEDWDLMQTDGLHPSAEAQPQLLENVWPHLEPLVQEQRAAGNGNVRGSVDSGAARK